MNGGKANSAPSHGVFQNQGLQKRFCKQKRAVLLLRSSHVSWDKNPGLYPSDRADTSYRRVQIMGCASRTAIT